MIQMKIEGMTCQHCVRSVQGALASVPGGQIHLHALGAGKARVGGSPDPAALVAAVEEEGFTATLAE